MVNENSITTDRSIAGAREAFSVHWRAVFAGVFIAMLVYFLLVSLGVAVGSNEVKDVIAGDQSGQSLGIGAAIWIVLTVLISLFAGSYASGRVSGSIATHVGYTQGAVVAAFFFALLLTQIGMAVGMLGSGLGAVKNAATGAASEIINSSRLNSVVEDSVADLNLRAAPDVVARGVLTRLLRGDTDSAINYLSAQSGISREEARTRFEALSAQVQAAATEVGAQAASATRTAGWTAFALILLGTLAAMLGGAIGAQMSLRRPIGALDRRALKFQQPAYE